MIKDKNYFDSLTEKVIGCAYKVGNELGYGFLEKVYENALRVELSNSAQKVDQQKPIKVEYYGEIVGDYVADLIVENELIVELKVTKKLEGIHIAQCLNYLKATRKHLCLLVNFGGTKVQIKRVVNNFR